MTDEYAPVDLDELDKQQARQRRKLDRWADGVIANALSNEDGLQRLRDISDEEWQAAVDAETGADGA